MAAKGMNMPPPFLPGPFLWRQWKQMLENYLVAINGSSYPAARKKAILLSCLGAEGQQIFFTLTETQAYEATEGNEYLEALSILGQHFEPQENEIAARVRFRSRAQRPGESIDAFMTALRTLVMPCKYEGKFMSEMLRDQLVEKLTFQDYNKNYCFRKNWI